MLVALFLAQLNLSIDGQTLVQGRVYDLDPNLSEVIDCVTTKFLIPAAPDGSFPDAPLQPTAVRCCGA